ncbi:sodium-dependent lysophosphatidylcholine symporter 1-like [Polypterus senegalus]|nr:sodium-dependent lysophosphatidylcholine symporter 1-like [Polypterus senegalus]
MGSKCKNADRGSDNQTTETNLPFSRKICYAIGGAPYHMTGNALAFFLQIFFLDVVHMEASYVSVILFTGRAWDAITDPFVGYLVSKSKKTRFGKLIPWAVFTMPFGVCAYILLWFSLPDSVNSGLKFFWHFMMYCLFQTFMTCYHVPYTALNMFLGGNQKERDSATAYRMAVEMFGTLAGCVIQGQIVGVYHAKTAQKCSEQNFTVFNSSSTLAESVIAMRKAYIVAAVLLGGFYFICAIILLVGVKEQAGVLTPLGQSKLHFFSGLRCVITHKAYLRLICGFLFSSLAFQMAQGNFALFSTHAAGLGHSFQHLVVIMLVAATLSVPIWQLLLGRFGKKTILFVGLSCYIPVLAIIAASKSSFILFAILGSLAGASLASLYLIPWSMLPDVIDDFKVKNPNCMDLEPIFYSCYVFFNKFGGGIAQGSSNLILHFAGYKPGACVQEARVVTSLKILFAPIPIGLLLLGLLMFYFYPINEERRKELKAQLEQIRKEKETHEDKDTVI